MAAPKQQTLMQKFGFADSDLITPKHDAIMCWLEDNANALFDIDTLVHDWEDDEIDRAKRRAVPRADAYGDDLRATLPIPPAGPRWRVRTTWESPAKTARGFTVGYIDLRVVIQRRLLDGVAPHERGGGDPIQAWWADMAVYSCEVKSAIPSLGELFRQLSAYRDCPGTGQIVVVSPDTRHRERIESQGYRFIEAPVDV